jgi:putative transposase
MLKGYRYKLDPTPEQYHSLSQTCGNCRSVYNYLLGKQKEEYAKTGKFIRFKDMSKMLTALRNGDERPWLRDSSRVPLQQAVINLDRALTNFFNSRKKAAAGEGGQKAGFPAFKCKHRSEDTAKYVNGVAVDFVKRTINLEKVGKVKFLRNREFPSGSKIINATVTRDRCGDMWVSVLVEDGSSPVPKAKVSEEGAVGIDMGLKDLAILSDGTVYENPRYMEKLLGKIKVIQQAFSRTKAGSNRHEAMRRKLAKLYRKLRDCRVDYIHKMTCALTDNFSTVVIEDLSVKGMMSNHNLALHIQSASWGEIERQLDYKCKWKGVNLIRIGRFFPSSRTCSVCGYHNPDLTLSDREWTCPECGTRLDRDLNASVNILKEGLRIHLEGARSKTAQAAT